MVYARGPQGCTCLPTPFQALAQLLVQAPLSPSAQWLVLCLNHVCTSDIPPISISETHFLALSGIWLEKFVDGGVAARPQLEC